MFRQIIISRATRVYSVDARVKIIVCRYAGYTGTQGIFFGRKTNEIAKLVTTDEKNKSHIFGRKCVKKSKNEKLCNQLIIFIAKVALPIAWNLCLHHECNVCLTRKLITLSRRSHYAYDAGFRIFYCLFFLLLNCTLLLLFECWKNSIQ